ncbi:MAG TPA: asparaginase [Nitrospiraceae bacterium]|nr:asparaginase [Nitrospiraceae bacterium]
MIIPTVHLIGTGGTIAGKLGSSGEITPGLSVKQLLNRIPIVANHALVTAEDFLQVSSGDIGMPEMLALAHRIDAILADPGISGTVVTHGTTTLEQTAYLLDTVLQQESPIVLTGAMRNPTLVSDDGPINLLNSMQVAACPRSRGLGVLVVMNGYIHAARDVTKSHPSDIDAFQSAEFGPLGAIDEDYVFYARRPFVRLPKVMPKAMTARVRLIPFGASKEELLREAVIAGDLDGLVVEATMLNPEQLDLVSAAMARGIFVVMANPFPAGRLPRGTYRRKGSETHLLDLGVAFAGTSGLKAKIKLAVTLSAGMPPEEIREAFQAEWH